MERKDGKKFHSEACRKEFWRNGGLPIKHFEAIVEARFDLKFRQLILDPTFIGELIEAVRQYRKKQKSQSVGLPAHKVV